MAGNRVPNHSIEPDLSTEQKDSLGRPTRICPACNGRVIMKYG